MKSIIPNQFNDDAVIFASQSMFPLGFCLDYSTYVGEIICLNLKGLCYYARRICIILYLVKFKPQFWQRLFKKKVGIKTNENLFYQFLQKQKAFEGDMLRGLREPGKESTWVCSIYNVTNIK